MTCGHFWLFAKVRKSLYEFFLQHLVDLGEYPLPTVFMGIKASMSKPYLCPFPRACCDQSIHDQTVTTSTPDLFPRLPPFEFRSSSG